MMWECIVMPIAAVLAAIIAIRLVTPERTLGMQMATAIYAKMANSARRRWAEELKIALDARDWDRIERLHHRMDNFVFDESLE
jgi:hypothetical protein